MYFGNAILGNLERTHTLSALNMHCTPTAGQKHSEDMISSVFVSAPLIWKMFNLKVAGQILAGHSTPLQQRCRVAHVTCPCFVKTQMMKKTNDTLERSE